FTITVLVGSSYADGGSLSNTASIASTATADPAAGNNSSTATVTVTRKADLKVTKTAAPAPATAGTDETFTIKVDNLGPSDNAGFSLTDALPAGTSFVSASAACLESTGTVTCTSGGVANGASVTW